MLGSLYSGISGLDAASISMESIGNNIANVNTCAFKAGTVSFASVFSETSTLPGGMAGNEEGRGVKIAALNSVWDQGPVDSTGNPTDLNISGDGFFKVVEDDGNVATTDPSYYTRAGQFSWDDNLNLVDPEGRIVQGFGITDPADPSTVNTASNLNILIPAGYTEASIEDDGFIAAVNPSGIKEYLFQVSVFNFPNNGGLRKVTGNLYEESMNSGAPTNATGNPSGQNGAGTVAAAGLEMSNVDLAREFVDLIVTQRSYQANSRVISTSADLLSEIINIVR